MMVLQKGKSRPVGSISPDGKRIKNSKGKWVPYHGSKKAGTHKDTFRNSARESGDDLDTLSKTVADKIMKDSGNKYEMAGLITADGNVKYITQKNTGSVKFTDDDMDLMYGGVLVHNHPRGFSFSEVDLGLSVINGFKRIEAITDTKRFVYTLPEKNKYYADNVLLSRRVQYSRVQDDYLTPIYKQVRNELQPKVTNLEITPQQASVLHARMFCKLFAEQFGGKYEEFDR